MKRFIFKSEATLLAALLLLTGCGRSQATVNQSTAASTSSSTSPTGPNAPATASVAYQKYSDDELDEMLAPVALYPDPLLAQMIPAATFFDQLEEAQRTLNGKSDDDQIANQSWDVSVKSVAHYPQVLQMMVEKQDRTIAIGQAYVTQPDDVTKSIQRLRAQAKDAGNLVTTKQQQVTTQGNVIKIEPAQPQVIYVPQYDPQVVYVASGPSTGQVIAASAISFGVGLAIGAWLNNDYDYYGRGIYYHGWVGGGWISANRTFVNVNRNVYINNSYRNINVNRNIVNRNISTYRTSLNRDATVRRERVEANRTSRNDRVAAEKRNNLRERDVKKNGRLDRSTTGQNINRQDRDVARTTNNRTNANSGGNRTVPNRSSSGSVRNSSAGRSAQKRSSKGTAKKRSSSASQTKTRRSAGTGKRH
jgi:uncharacterized protein DUF3300